MFDVGSIPVVLTETFPRWDRLRLDREDAVAAIGHVLEFVCKHLTPALARTTDETAHLLRALDGRHVPAGPSGAPTRGMAHILPTGRNFFTVDPRALPSMAAWRVGQELAREVLERHIAETGSFPETVGISVWGTSAMRTHGDDVAQVLAFLGVRPCWQKESRRVAGIEVVPLEQLGRPRVDVVVRISGFFRDAFPHLIALLDEAARLVMQLDEPPGQNFPRKHFLADVEAAASPETCAFDLERKAAYRIFGSKPESYGAGILPLIDQQNWDGPADLAEAYVNWGGYAYTADEQGIDARDLFRRRLVGVQVALHNQDNREHDIFDSDDYLQFHGGMIATIRPDGPQAEALFRRHSRPVAPRRPRPQGGGAAGFPHARHQPQVDRERRAPWLQGRVGIERDGRLPVRLRRHRQRRRRLDVRASRSDVCARSAHARIL